MEKYTEIETRPAVYFPTMTDGELLSYAEQFAVTTLEKELLCRMTKYEAEDKYCGHCDRPIQGE